MRHTVLAEARSRVRMMTRGIGLAVMGSAVFHLVGLLVIHKALQGRVSDPSLRSLPTRAIELEFFKLAPREPATAPETQPPEEHQSMPGPVSGPMPDTAQEPRILNRATEDLWQPFSRRDKKNDGENRDLDRFLSLATCPRFIDPSDLDLVDRCAGRGFARSESDTGIANVMAEQFEREAIERGWAVAAVATNPEQASLEREFTTKAPGAEVFGPWPWEAKP